LSQLGITHLSFFLRGKIVANVENGPQFTGLLALNLNIAVWKDKKER
jgi:hypothetical protein